MKTLKKLTSDEKGKLTGGFSVQSKNIKKGEDGITININCVPEDPLSPGNADILNYNCTCSSCDESGTIA